MSIVKEVPRYLVVDGHSVIFAWPGLNAIHRKNPGRARDALRRSLEDLHDTSEWLVTLVFDGKAGDKTFTEKGRMVVLFAHADQTADSIIEQLVGKAPKPEQVTVVTADHAEQQTVEAMGATCLSPQWLEQELEAHQASWSQTINIIHKKAHWKLL